jgi:IS30 family transposase
MLSKEDWMEIKAQTEKGVYMKDIAQELGVHPKTGSRARRTASLSLFPFRVGRNSIRSFVDRSV